MTFCPQSEYMSELPAEGRSTMRLFYHKVRALSSIDSFPFCNPSFRSATVKNHRSSGADGCRCALTLWTGRFLDVKADADDTAAVVA